MPKFIAQIHDQILFNLILFEFDLDTRDEFYSL